MIFHPTIIPDPPEETSSTSLVRQSNISPEAMSHLTTWHLTRRHFHFSIFHLGVGDLGAMFHYTASIVFQAKLK